MRPEMITDPRAAHEMAAKIENLLDDNLVSAASQRELDALRYAIAIASSPAQFESDCPAVLVAAMPQRLAISARTAPHRPATHLGGPAPLMVATTHASGAAKGRRDTPGIAGCRKFLTVKPRSTDLEPGYRLR
jgi:hypothetical protein